MLIDTRTEAQRYSRAIYPLLVGQECQRTEPLQCGAQNPGAGLVSGKCIFNISRDAESGECEVSVLFQDGLRVSNLYHSD